jgi:ribulose-phosphate 3-epimerase
MVKIAPSVLAADILQLGSQIELLEKAGCEYLHLDIMDGNFVPNISFGSVFVKGLRPLTKMIFDVHMMVADVTGFLDDFAAAGADIITVHYEACTHLDRTIEHIHELGLKAGVALNPATSLWALEEILPKIELVLLMSVNPGFCGQKFIAATLDKIPRLVKMRRERDLDFIVEVDGGIGEGNVGSLAMAGADLLVAGNAVFAKEDPVKAFEQLMVDKL